MRAVREKSVKLKRMVTLTAAAASGKNVYALLSRVFVWLMRTGDGRSYVRCEREKAHGNADDTHTRTHTQSLRNICTTHTRTHVRLGVRKNSQLAISMR